MVELFGRERSRTEINERTGALQQVAGVELLEYADGPERGVRVLDFRTGAGLSFRVAVDRGFDLLVRRLSGRADRLALADRAAPSRPRLGRGEPRLGLPALVHRAARDVWSGPRARARDLERGAVHLSGLHRSRLSAARPNLPDSARLLGYGERWRGDGCTLWAEAEIAQMAVFGENLVLTRRIEAELGGASLSVDDRVENRGFRPTPHMLLYHYNFGYPLLDEGAELLVPSRAIVHAVHGDLHAQGVSAIASRDRPRPTSASRSMSTTWSPPPTAWPRPR